MRMPATRLVDCNGLLRNRQPGLFSEPGAITVREMAVDFDQGIVNGRPISPKSAFGNDRCSN
jgi:hypothetical protein